MQPCLEIPLETYEDGRYTLAAVFQSPVSASVFWNFLRAGWLGCQANVVSWERVRAGNRSDTIKTNDWLVSVNVSSLYYILHLTLGTAITFLPSTILRNGESGLIVDYSVRSLSVETRELIANYINLRPYRVV